MNWKLIFSLSLFGLVMAFGTVYVIASNVEPIFWLAIFLVCALVIAKRAPRSYFLHGLMVGVVNSIWVTGAHVFLFARYVAGHHKEAAMMASMPLPTHPRVMMLIVGPAIGVVSGAIIGVLALGLGKIVTRRPATA